MNEEFINMLESMRVPSTYWKGKTATYIYWFRSLLHKIDSSLIFDGLPIEWNNDFFMLCLWAFGRVVVFSTNREDISDKYGSVTFQPCTLSGYNWFYQPNKASVSHSTDDDRPYEKEFRLGEDAELIKLTPDYCGILDIIDYYASKLAEISKGIDMGIINAKLPCILTAENDAQAETLKKVYDKVQAGEPLVVFKELNDNGEIIPTKSAFEEWTQDYKKTYVVHNLLEDMQLILDSFYVEIGLPVAIEKKERLVTSEADFASAQSQARISCWLETLRESLTRVNKMFNINITCEVAFNERENDVNRNTKNAVD